MPGGSSKVFGKDYKMENDKELTKQDLQTIAVILRTVADMNVLSACFSSDTLRSMSDRVLFTSVNGIQFKE